MSRSHPEPRWWQRPSQRPAASRLLSHTLHRLDRVPAGVPGGWVSVPGVSAWLPAVALSPGE